MTRRFGFLFLHLFVLAYCGVLVSAIAVQFAEGEFPCPLCILQRMAMMLVCLGPIYIIRKTRDGDVSLADFATGYGIALVAAVAGLLMSSRQVLLHIKPPDPGYGTPIVGLHLYTWALITFLVVILASGIMMMFAREFTPHGVGYGMLSKIVVWLFVAIVAANVVAVFVEEGFHWFLPDNPTQYQLLYDLGIKG